MRPSGDLDDDDDDDVSSIFNGFILPLTPHLPSVTLSQITSSLWPPTAESPFLPGVGGLFKKTTLFLSSLFPGSQDHRYHSNRHTPLISARLCAWRVLLLFVIRSDFCFRVCVCVYHFRCVYQVMWLCIKLAEYSNTESLNCARLLKDCYCCMPSI